MHLHAPLLFAPAAEESILLYIISTPGALTSPTLARPLRLQGHTTPHPSPSTHTHTTSDPPSIPYTHATARQQSPASTPSLPTTPTIYTAWPGHLLLRHHHSVHTHFRVAHAAQAARSFAPHSCTPTSWHGFAHQRQQRPGGTSSSQGGAALFSPHGGAHPPSLSAAAVADVADQARSTAIQVPLGPFQPLIPTDAPPLHAAHAASLPAAPGAGGRWRNLRHI